MGDAAGFICRPFIDSDSCLNADDMRAVAYAALALTMLGSLLAGMAGWYRWQRRGQIWYTSERVAACFGVHFLLRFPLAALVLLQRPLQQQFMPHALTLAWTHMSWVPVYVAGIIYTASVALAGTVSYTAGGGGGTAANTGTITATTRLVAKQRRHIIRLAWWIAVGSTMLVLVVATTSGLLAQLGGQVTIATMLDMSLLVLMSLGAFASGVLTWRLGSRLQRLVQRRRDIEAQYAAIDRPRPRYTIKRITSAQRQTSMERIVSLTIGLTVIGYAFGVLLLCMGVLLAIFPRNNWTRVIGSIVLNVVGDLIVLVMLCGIITSFYRWRRQAPVRRDESDEVGRLATDVLVDHYTMGEDYQPLHSLGALYDEHHSEHGDDNR